MSEEKDKHIVIIGGGTAGSIAATELAGYGCSVSLLEKESETGGKVKDWYQLFPDRRMGSEVTDFLKKGLDSDLIEVMTGTEVENIIRTKGKFSVSTNKGEIKEVDAVLLATGFDLFRAERKEEYGYGIYHDVITSVELEKMFHDGGILTSKAKVPARIGIVHCVGSRDEKVGNFHCSKVCCVTAVKQAIEIKEKLPDTEVFCYYMDMRMFGPYYEELYRESQEKWGVNFIRGKVSEATENIEGRIIVKVEDTLAGRPLKMEVDLLVLMLGMENSHAGMKVAKMLKLKTGKNNFFEVVDNHYGSNLSAEEGVFFAGACTAAMNITDTVSHARSAASEIINYLKNRGNG